MTRNTPFATCATTSIQDPLLEAIITNKKRIYPTINPITSGGHGRPYQAKHLLTFILRSALGIYRLPGHDDIVLDPAFFTEFSDAEIYSAICDARRIYEFTQKEMRKINHAVYLTRGLRHPESSVAFTLASKLNFPLHLPFQTFAFFNHITEPFDGDAILRIDAPIEWVWASEYTLSDLKISQVDEEFIIVVDSLDGCIDIPLTSISFSSFAEEIEINADNSVYLECLGKLFCGEKTFRDVATNYEPGLFEGIGRKIDRRLLKSGIATLSRKTRII